jgi:hypothetical protein
VTYQGKDSRRFKKKQCNSIAYIDLKFPAFKNSIVDLPTEVTDDSDIISLFESKVSI